MHIHSAQVICYTEFIKFAQLAQTGNTNVVVEPLYVDRIRTAYIVCYAILYKIHSLVFRLELDTADFMAVSFQAGKTSHTLLVLFYNTFS